MFSRSSTGKTVVTRPGSDNVEIEETLSALDRARHFGASKLSLQRLVFVKELVDTAHEIGYDATVTHLLPLVQKLASDPEVLVRQSLVGNFGDLAGFLIQSDPEKGYQKVVDDLLPAVSLLLNEKASDVRQGAADALTTLASHLRPGERGDQVLMTVISLSHSNDDEDARSTAVQLLNSLAEALGADLCQQFVGVELVALCEDPAFRVRKATASNFAEISRVVGDAYVLKRLIPAFAQLVHDAHWGVRKAAAESLVSLAMSILAEKRREALVPFVNDLLKDSSRWVRMSALQQLGYFIASLEASERVPEGLLTQYVEVIQQSKANPDAADISFHCAYTFAAVTQTMGKEGWPQLKAPFASLCTDPQFKTRKAMAASMHIVAQTLGADVTEQEVLPQFEYLLQDASHEVRLSALKNVASILRVAPGTVPQRRALKALHSSMNKADNWRTRQLAGGQLGPICAALLAAPEPVPGDDHEDPVQREKAASAAAAAAWAEGEGSSSPSKRQKAAAAKDLTWSVIVPLFLQLCGDAVAQVRDSAAHSAACVLRAAAPEMFVEPGAAGGAQEEGSSGCSPGVQLALPRHSTRLVRHLIRTFARSRSFRNRMVYIRMCDSIIRESPMHVFSDLFMRPLVRLASDKVRNVRLCWVNAVLPHLRKVGRLGQNTVMIATATRLMRTALKNANDPEVARLLSGAVLPAVSEDEIAALPDPESDLDDSDAGEGWLAKEGGTGDSSECSDVGVGEEEEDEEKKEIFSPPRRDEHSAQASAPQTSVLAPRCLDEDLKALESLDLPAAAPPVLEASAAAAVEPEVPAAPLKKAPPALEELENLTDAASAVKHKIASPKGPTLASLALPQAPRSPLRMPTSPGHDAVEDGLIHQDEIDRDLDLKFADRRLVAETEGSDPSDLGIWALDSSTEGGSSCSRSEAKSIGEPPFGEAKSFGEAALLPEALLPVVQAARLPEALLPVVQAARLPEAEAVAEATSSTGGRSPADDDGLDSLAERVGEEAALLPEAVAGATSSTGGRQSSPADNDGLDSLAEKSSAEASEAVPDPAPVADALVDLS